MNDLKIFSGRSNPTLTTRICDYLGIPKGLIALSNFPDSEISCKLEENVRGRDVYLVQSTENPGGIGEPSTAPIAGAIANAVFAATGKRVYTLPIKAEALRGGTA